MRVRVSAIGLGVLAMLTMALSGNGVIIAGAANQTPGPGTLFPQSGSIVPNAVNELDCNGFSAAYAPAKASIKPLCADPIQHDANGHYYKANDNGHYIGHDEPSVKFESTAPGSANHMTYYMQLPVDPAAAPQPDGSKSIYAMLSPAPWFGMSVCDPNSDPVGPCTPDTDPPINKPNTAGQAFMELQFYPPGFQPFNDNVSCDPTKWCSAMTIDSVTCPTKNAGICLPNVNCFEPVNFAFLQIGGVPAGPPSPQLVNNESFTPNASTLKMGQNDTLRVTLQDHIVAGDDAHSGLMTSIDDLTTGQTGFMIASSSNGFMNTDSNTCNGAPFSFHPTYSTAAKANMLPWSVLEGGILMEQEIGHMETCSSLLNAGPTGIHYSNNEVFIDNSTMQTCVGGIPEGGTMGLGEGPCAVVSLLSTCVGATTEGGGACPQNIGQGVNSCEGSDATCIPAGSRSVITGIPPATVTTMYTNPLNECQANQAQNGDLDFDGNDYITDWPDGTANHPSSIRYLGPFDSAGQIYPDVQIETDLAGSEQNCSLSSTSTNCAVPPYGTGNLQTFYPYWSLTNTQGINSLPQGLTAANTCTWNFGNTIAGVTTNDLTKDGEYGSGTATSRGDFISNVEPNPEFNGNCPLSPFSVPPPPAVLPFGTTCPGPQILDLVSDAPNTFPGGTGQNMDNLDIVQAAFATEKDGGGNATFLDVTMTMKNLTVPPDATFDSNLLSGFWSVHWIYAGNPYLVQAEGSANPASVMFVAGPDPANAASAQTNDTSIATGSSFNTGSGPAPSGTIFFHVPVGVVGSPPNGALLTHTFAETNGSPVPTGAVFYTAPGDVAPDGSGNPAEPGFAADYVVGQTVCVPPNIPEAPLVPLVVIGGGIVALVGSRRLAPRLKKAV
jgi:hypothetical protein